MRQTVLHLLHHLDVQPGSRNEQTRFWVILIAGCLLIVYLVGTNALPLAHTDLPQRPGSQGNTEAKKIGEKSTRKKEESALATLTASTYVVKIHWAISYVPLTAERLLQPEPGKRYVILDVSVRNTSEELVDIGTLFLTATVHDDQKKQYVADPLAVAAFQLDYPYPNHHSQYLAMKGELKPGAVCRTTFFGFAAPLTTNHFVLQMQDGVGKRQWHNADFFVQ